MHIENAQRSSDPRSLHRRRCWVWSVGRMLLIRSFGPGRGRFGPPAGTLPVRFVGRERCRFDSLAGAPRARSLHQERWVGHRSGPPPVRHADELSPIYLAGRCCRYRARRGALVWTPGHRAAAASQSMRPRRFRVGVVTRRNVRAVRLEAFRVAMFGHPAADRTRCAHWSYLPGECAEPARRVAEKYSATTHFIDGSCRRWSAGVELTEVRYRAARPSGQHCGRPDRIVRVDDFSPTEAAVPAHVN